MATHPKVMGMDMDMDMGILSRREATLVGKLQRGIMMYCWLSRYVDRSLTRCCSVQYLCGMVDEG